MFSYVKLRCLLDFTGMYWRPLMAKTFSSLLDICRQGLFCGLTLPTSHLASEYVVYQLVFPILALQVTNAGVKRLEYKLTNYYIFMHKDYSTNNKNSNNNKTIWLAIVELQTLNDNLCQWRVYSSWSSCHRIIRLLTAWSILSLRSKYSTLVHFCIPV